MYRPRSTKNCVNFSDVFTIIGTDSFSSELKEAMFPLKDLDDGCVLWVEIAGVDAVMHVHRDYVDVVHEIYSLGECSTFVRDDNGEEVGEYPKIKRRYYRK